MTWTSGIAATSTWLANSVRGGQAQSTGPAQPGGPSDPARPSSSSPFTSVFGTTFSQNLMTVFERGAQGEFDDPQLRLQEQAALARLRDATAAGVGSGNGGALPRPGATAGSSAVSGGGGTAAPDAGTTEATPGVSSSATSGSPPPGADGAPTPSAPATTTTGGPAPGAPAAPHVAGQGPPAAAPAGGEAAQRYTEGASSPTGGAAPGVAHQPTTDAVAARRAVYDVRVRQSEARLTNISQKLRAEYPKAASLESASSGRWDPATFHPRSKAEAEAFAQRMVIDATEAAARLDVLKNELDAARVDAGAPAGQAPTAQARVRELEAAFARQHTYVAKLSRIVDEASGGQLTAAGLQALAGETLRDENDLPAEELAGALRASGMSERDVQRVVGADETAIEEDRTPGGSQRLRTMSTSMEQFFAARALNDFQRKRMERDNDERTAEAERKRLDEKRQGERREHRRIEQRQVEVSQARRRAAQVAAEVAAAQVAAARRQQQARPAG